MSYAKKHRLISRPLGLSGSQADCGAGQVYYPNLTFSGITGICSTPAQAQAALSSGAASGSLDTTPGGGGGGFAAALMSAFAPPKAPAYPPGYNPYAQQGMSTGTMLALGLGAVGLLAFFMLRD